MKKQDDSNFNKPSKIEYGEFVEMKTDHKWFRWIIGGLMALLFAFFSLIVYFHSDSKDNIQESEQRIINKINILQIEIQGLKTETQGLKTEMQGLKTDVRGLKQRYRGRGGGS